MPETSYQPIPEVDFFNACLAELEALIDSANFVFKREYGETYRHRKEEIGRKRGMFRRRQHLKLMIIIKF
jgi:hypothetical protein